MKVTTRNVRETIHHGDYYNERWLEIELTPAGVAKLLAGSPYRPGRSILSDDPTAQRIARELAAEGSSQLGWADFTVVAHADPTWED